MKFINGTNRNQLPLLPHRLMMPLRKTTKSDLLTFCDSLKLADFGFIFDFVENGSLSSFGFTQTLYLRLSIMRSSRTLEKECNRNIELMWLLKGLVPDHNTIANFRKDNSKAIARIFGPL
jgi:hypothetical protein